MLPTQVKNSKIKRWIPAITMCLVIFLFSSIHGNTIQKTGLGQESIQINAHFFLYFLLSITFYKATDNIFYAIILSFFYSITDEIHQTFVPGRAFQNLDIFVDTMGASLAGLILWKLHSRLPMKLKNWLTR